MISKTFKLQCPIIPIPTSIFICTMPRLLGDAEAIRRCPKGMAEHNSTNGICLYAVWLNELMGRIAFLNQVHPKEAQMHKQQLKLNKLI